MADRILKRAHCYGSTYTLRERDRYGDAEYFVSADGTMLGTPSPSLAKAQADFSAVTGQEA